MKLVGTFLFVFLLASCTTPSQQPQGLWHRTDGRSMQSDRALLKQGEIDRTACDGERQKALAAKPASIFDDTEKAAFEVMKGCMAQRGYIWREDGR